MIEGRLLMVRRGVPYDVDRILTVRRSHVLFERTVLGEFDDCAGLPSSSSASALQSRPLAATPDFLCLMIVNREVSINFSL